MKHNNALPNNHFKKTAIRFKTWFNQEAKCEKRRNLRNKRVKCTLMPIKKLRPIVRCQTLKYNKFVRLGAGFSLQECEAVNLDPLYARTIGIRVDCRRKNKSQEGLDANVERLQTYLSNLTVFKNKEELKAALKESKTTPPSGQIMPIKRRADNVVEYVQTSSIVSTPCAVEQLKALRKEVRKAHGREELKK